MLIAPDNRLYLGLGGSGKTTLAASHASSFPRVVFCDPNGEKVFESGAHIVTDRRQLLELLARPGPVRICWRGVMGAAGEDATREAFEWLNRCAWACGDVLCVWEEIDILCGGGKLPPNAYRLVNAGRHRDVRIFACARSPKMVPRAFTRNASRIAVFRTIEPLDLDYLRQYMGTDAAAVLPGLQRFEALDWTQTGFAVRKSPYA